MQDYSVSRCSELFYRVDRVRRIFETGAPTLTGIRRDYGGEFLTAYVAMWIVNLNEFLNVKTKMNAMQVEETARMLAKEFYRLTVADVHFVFEQVKRGELKIYDRLDGSLILAWFRQHAEKRLDEHEQMLIEKDSALKEARTEVKRICEPMSLKELNIKRKSDGR